MFATTDPVIVETRPADEPAGPAKTEQPTAGKKLDPWERPAWQAHRARVLASPLYAELKAFVAQCEKLVAEAFRLADALGECPDGEGPFEAAPGGREDTDYTGEAVGELCAIARMLNNGLGFFNGEL